MRHLLRALARSPDPLSDAALLARYAADRDPAAFEVLVWRHGGLVLGVCRRRLRDAHAAEDAFQATFLILSRQAGRVRADTLPGFLHRVARRVAGRAALNHHRRREAPLVVDPTARPSADPELAAVLDAEIDRLPNRLRQVVVLCYLDGQSTEAAAARLNVPRGTVLSRLHTARAKLRDRLTRRGVTPPAAGLTLGLTAEQVAGGVRAAGGGVGAVTILANEVLTMSVRKLAWGVAAVLVLAGGAGTGVGVLNARSGGAGDDPAPKPAAKAAEPPDRRMLVEVAAAKVDALWAQAREEVARLPPLPTDDLAELERSLAEADSKLAAAERELEYARVGISQALEYRQLVAAVETLGRIDPASPELRRVAETAGGGLLEANAALAAAERQVAAVAQKPDAALKKAAAAVAAMYRQKRDGLLQEELDHLGKLKMAELAGEADNTVFAAVISVQREEADLPPLRDRQKELAVRVAEQRSRKRRQAAAEQELADLADLRRDLRRLRLAWELGVPELAGTPPPHAPDALLRRLEAVEKKLEALPKR